MTKVLLALIRLYQRHISAHTPPMCRFTPTCSAYAYEALTRHGAARGSWLALRRLARCGPWYDGPSHDPVPLVKPGRSCGPSCAYTTRGGNAAWCIHRHERQEAA